MSIDPELREWYNAKLREYLDKGYAVKLLPSRIHSPRGLVWYLPHFVIQNKRRLVFDAAAKVDGKSLLNILLHFRQGKVGVCADIQEMFHRVLIRDEDQDASDFCGGKTRLSPFKYMPFRP